MIAELAFPPGVYRNGTIQQSRGRYYDSNLVRWFEGSLRPWGGWLRRGSTTTTGVPRAMLNWSDNTLVRWTGIGTHSKLYVMDRSGVLYDITPAGFTAGSADASTYGGYGGGTYGSGYYGTPRPDSGTVVEATRWHLDTFGENLVGCTPDDGKLYKWTLATGTPAAVIASAPTNCRGLVVTEESFLMALQKNRVVAWCDQQDETTWTPSATNQAGSIPIQTAGKLMCGQRIKGGTLIFTNLEVFLATYLGPPLIYGFEQLASECGIVSSGAMAHANHMVVWMGNGGFWIYDGYIRPLACDLGDYVFSDINALQSSKVFAHHNASFGEAIWFYPSAASTEIDRYVMWNYRENHWSKGELSRTAGAEQGVFSTPMMATYDGKVYDHETGFNFDGSSPYAETGPMELNNGATQVMVRQLIPDEKTLGDVNATFYVRPYPTAAEETFGPYSLANPTDVRFSGREVRVRFTQVNMADWRVGSPRLDLVTTGLR